MVHFKFNIMAVLQITSRQFRDKQKAIFELADKGEKIIIRRGDKQAYVLVPVDDDDLYFTPEMLAKIDMAVQQAKEGEVTYITSKEDLNNFLNTL